MKKILKITFMVIMLNIFTFIFSKNVMAESIEKLTLDYANNPYYYRVWDNYTDTGKLTYYNLNNEVAYCVEPGIHITDDTYVETSNSNLNIDNDTLNKIKLIGYYGYEYPNHATTNYRMATQALIWEAIRGIKVSYYTGRDATGDYVNVDNERQNILNLVSKHYTLPSLKKDLVLSFGVDNIISDKNSVLDSFEIINNDSNLEIFNKGNELHIKSDVIGDYEITLRKKKYDNKTSVLYMGSDGKSQKIMKLRVDDNLEMKIIIHIVGGKLNLHKLDYDIKNNKTFGLSTLKDARYGIFDESNNLIEELTTNSLGEVSSNNLKYGKYYIKELKASYGYLLDETKYNFTISENNLVNDLTVYEKLDKKNINIKKSIEGDILKGESDIQFEIYEHDSNQLYDIITTDKDGIAKINLPYGNYIIHQVNTTKGFLKYDDFEITVDDKLDEYNYNLVDKKIKVDFMIVKTLEEEDFLVTSESDIEFEIYEHDSNKLYQIITTDKDGIAKTKLPYGNYIIHQVNTTKGYLKCDDFEITVDDKLDKYHYNLIDKKIKGNLKIIKSDIQNNLKLSNALIEVYKDDLLIYSGYTDKDGLIVLNNLEFGKYKIIEKEAPIGYINNNEEYYIEILEDNQDYVLEITNKLEEIIVPNTASDYNKVIKYSSMFILLIGLGFIYFAKYKKI